VLSDGMNKKLATTNHESTKQEQEQQMIDINREIEKRTKVGMEFFELNYLDDFDDFNDLEDDEEEEEEEDEEELDYEDEDYYDYIQEATNNNNKNETKEAYTNTEVKLNDNNNNNNVKPAILIQPPSRSQTPTLARASSKSTQGLKI
jgi:hypothetical protein